VTRVQGSPARSRPIPGVCGRAFGFGAVLLVLGACSDTPPADAEAGQDSPVEQVVRTDPFRVTGAFEGASFYMTPCSDSELDVRLVPGPEVLDLVGIHGELVPGDTPVETIFVDLLGEAIEERGEISFEVLEVYRAGWEDWGCTWQPLVEDLRFAASGTEPGWTVHVAMDSTVRLSRMDGTVEGRATAIEGTLASGWTISGSVGSEAFTLELDEAPCRNEMSGGWSHLEALLTLEGEERRGCGFIGELVEGV
jgi:uncharacterized membrane protein